VTDLGRWAKEKDRNGTYVAVAVWVTVIVGVLEMVLVGVTVFTAVAGGISAVVKALVVTVPVAIAEHAADMRDGNHVEAEAGVGMGTARACIGARRVNDIAVDD
jgi:hypothetical protein